jgi:hypothetical protein
MIKQKKSFNQELPQLSYFPSIVTTSNTSRSYMNQALKQNLTKIIDPVFTLNIPNQVLENQKKKLFKSTN